MEIRLTVLLLIIPALILQSCDFGTGSDDIRPEHSFEVGIYDENGNNLATITHHSSDNVPGVNSIAVFGNEFIPEEVRENFAESSDSDPEDFLQNEIYLHTGSNVSNGDSNLTLHFILSPETHFAAKTYPLIELPEEYFKESLKRRWKRANQNTESISLPEHGDHMQDVITDKDALAYLGFYQKGLISEFGFGNPVSTDRYLAMTRTGFIELTNSDESQIEGTFEAEIQAVFGELLFGDEFPDELDIEVYTVRGSFTAKAGNLEDLIRTVPGYPHFN